jgi:hypothetical protein
VTVLETFRAADGEGADQPSLGLVDRCQPAGQPTFSTGKDVDDEQIVHIFEIIRSEMQDCLVK